MRLYLLAYGFILLSAFIITKLFHGDLIDAQLWMEILLFTFEGKNTSK
jgi:hypothetical protein